MAEQSSAPQITWQEFAQLRLRGSKNLYRLQPRPDMLLGLIFVQRVSEYVEGQWLTRFYRVLYDRDYIVNWFQENWVTPMHDAGWSELSAILSEAYTPYRSPGRTRASKSKSRSSEELNGR